jgi:PAS domain S-box-containing protein
MGEEGSRIAPEAGGASSRAQARLNRQAAFGRDITERKQAEEALRQSEATNRAILSATPDMMFRMSREGEYLDFVPAKGLTPYVPPIDFLGKTVHEVLPEEMAAATIRHVEKALDTRQPQVFEYQLPTEGSLRDFEARIVVCGDDQALAVVRDVTDRKRSERALKETQERLRQLADNIREAFWLAAADGSEVFYVSPAFEEIWGRRCESLYEQPNLFAEWVHPRDRKRVKRSFSDLGEDGYELEFRILRPNGETRWVRAREFPVRDQAGNVYRVAGIAEDITERKRSEEAVRESEERYRQLADVSSEGIVMTDGDIIVDANGRFAKMFGYEVSEVIGASLSQLIPPESRDDVQWSLESAYERPYDHLAMKRDGTTFEVRSRGRSIPYEGRTVTITAMADITDRKQAERAVEAAREGLEGRVERRMHRASRLGLTFQEMKVLHLVADGKSDKEIGAALEISPHTAAKHMRNILTKMKVGSRTQAVAGAVRERLIE